MKKLTFVINGAGGVGKDTLCDLAAKHFRVYNISTIMPIKDIARSHSMSEAALKMKLHRIRAALKEFLETEGIEI